MDWKKYQTRGLFDEVISSDGNPRKASVELVKYLSSLSIRELKNRQRIADLAIQDMGITFTVYSEGENIDRSWPFDVIPRSIDKQEWSVVEQGLMQRITALNLFINDLYNQQKIIKDRVFPRTVLQSSKGFLKQCTGVKPKYGVWAHICGTDLVRDVEGRFFVLEDNLRVPSGVSYMLENRSVIKRVFPEIFRRKKILPVDDYPSQLFDHLTDLSPRYHDHPVICVLTPGIYNSAYYEHSYLAQKMGVELVEGADLFVKDDCVYMNTIAGPCRVDVIYRRIDDEFLDPEVFNKNSVLGVKSIMQAWRKGKVAIANAPGAGVADDKVVYTFVPEIIKYYLDEDPILPNVPSYRCMYKKEREYVLENIADLVVKPANESGGYGMLVGPKSSKDEINKFKSLIKENPRNYIAQPTLSLSTVPTLCDEELSPRHVDLRPFILQTKNKYVTPGGLTRVALRKGSLVVNSSQGGGSKDTWIV